MLLSIYILYVKYYNIYYMFIIYSCVFVLSFMIVLTRFSYLSDIVYTCLLLKNGIVELLFQVRSNALHEC